MIKNDALDFEKIFGNGSGFVLVDETVPVDPATVKPCRPIPYGDTEAPAAEATEAPCTRY